MKLIRSCKWILLARDAEEDKILKLSEPFDGLTAKIHLKVPIEGEKSRHLTVNGRGKHDMSVVLGSKNTQIISSKANSFRLKQEFAKTYKLMRIVNAYCE
jgi:hypothetical protein